MARRSTEITVLDALCGAGGTTEGFELEGIAVPEAFNHNQLALDTHASNHPQTRHTLADIQEVDPKEFKSTSVGWFSIACQPFGEAGNNKFPVLGMQRSLLEQKLELTERQKAREQQRAHAFDVCKFAETHQFPIIGIEQN